MRERERERERDLVSLHAGSDGDRAALPHRVPKVSKH